MQGVLAVRRRALGECGGHDVVAVRRIDEKLARHMATMPCASVHRLVLRIDDR